MAILFWPLSLLLAGFGITIVLFFYGLLRNARSYAAVSAVLAGLLLVVSVVWYYLAQLDSLRNAGESFPSSDLIVVAGSSLCGGLLLMWGVFWLWIRRAAKVKRE